MSKLIIEETNMTEIDFQNVLLEQNVATKFVTDRNGMFIKAIQRG